MERSVARVRECLTQIAHQMYGFWQEFQGSGDFWNLKYCKNSLYIIY